MGILPLRRSQLPEEAEYRDTGCELHSACLTCPLPLEVCPEEDFRRPRRDQVRAWAKARRARQLRAKGLTIAAIALALQISERSAFRYLQEGRSNVL